MNIPFIIKIVPVDETPPENLSPQNVAEFLARKKADAFDTPDENETLITADTIVSRESELLGKPSDEKDAFKILHKLPLTWPAERT